MTSSCHLWSVWVSHGAGHHSIARRWASYTKWQLCFIMNKEAFNAFMDMATKYHWLYLIYWFDLKYKCFYFFRAASSGLTSWIITDTMMMEWYRTMVICDMMACKLTPSLIIFVGYLTELLNSWFANDLRCHNAQVTLQQWQKNWLKGG